MNTLQPVSAMSKFSATANAVIDSTNGTINIILMAMFALGAVFGVGEEPISNLVLAIVPVIGIVREIIKGTRKARWSGNILTYIFTGILAALPWLGGVLDALQPLVEIVASGNLTLAAVLPIILPLINEAAILFREKPWANQETETSQ